MDGIAQLPEKRGWKQEPETVSRTLLNHILDKVIDCSEQIFRTLGEFRFVEFKHIGFERWAEMNLCCRFWKSSIQEFEDIWKGSNLVTAARARFNSN